MAESGSHLRDDNWSTQRKLSPHRPPGCVDGLGRWREALRKNGVSQVEDTADQKYVLRRLAEEGRGGSASLINVRSPGSRRGASTLFEAFIQFDCTEQRMCGISTLTFSFNPAEKSHSSKKQFEEIRQKGAEYDHSFWVISPDPYSSLHPSTKLKLLVNQRVAIQHL
jgi:hypothetical protein